MNYQERVSTRADVRALYEKVTADPTIARYRGYTESKSYGWDPQKEVYVKREGEFWFENPNYNAIALPEAEEEGEADLLDEQLTEREERIEELEADVAVLEEEITDLQCKLGEAEARALIAANERDEAEARANAAANERDDAKEALLELRRALVLVAQLAGVK